MNEQNHVLLVVNPVSGAAPKEGLIDKLLIETEKRSLKVRIYETTGKADETAIEGLLLSQQFFRIIVIGGDGTVQLVAKVAQKHRVGIGLIPAGSANGLAVSFGIPPTLDEQIKIALGPQTLWIDLLFINKHLCLHIADLGLNAELIKNYESSNLRGKLGYLVQSIPTLFQSQGPTDFQIEANGSIGHKTGILLAIANANKFGTGAIINPGGKINDGLFEILVFKSLNFIEIVKTLNENSEMSPDFVEKIVADKAKIKTETKVHFQIDGEYFGEVNEVDVEIKKQQLNIALPASFIAQAD